MTNRYIPEVHDQILTSMVIRWKRTDMQIANEMGFSVGTIKNHRIELGLAANEPPRWNTSQEDQTPAPPARPNPVAVAKETLAERLVEKPSGFWLDGRPVSLDTIMLETNRLRLEKGLEQVVNKPSWRVEPCLPQS